VPTAVAALRLSRQAERIVAAAPALLTARSQAQHQEVSATVVAEVGRLERLLHQLKGGTIDASGFAAIEAAVEGLRRNLDAAPDLPEGVAARLARQVRQFAELIEGPDSILEVRAQELALVTEGERLLAENGSLSGRLTAAVDKSKNSRHE
jgi:hypothetical protein